jgi:hypothetical protein
MEVNICCSKISFRLFMFFQAIQKYLAKFRISHFLSIFEHFFSI